MRITIIRKTKVIQIVQGNRTVNLKLMTQRIKETQ
jgi:hypothetical protein